MKKLIEETNIYWLTVIPFLAALTLILIVAFVGSYFFSKGLTDGSRDVLFGISSITIGLSGVVQIYKKEVPFLSGRPVTGVYAVIIGVSYSMFAWANAIFLFL